MRGDSEKDSKPKFERSAKKESESKSILKALKNLFDKPKPLREQKATSRETSRASSRSREMKEVSRERSSKRKVLEEVEEFDEVEISLVRKIFRGLGLVLSIILVCIVIMNLTIILKSYIQPDKVPSFLGVKLFIVETNSMKPEFAGGDIIFVKNIIPKDLEEGDVISYRDSRSIVTHRILEIEKTDEGLSFRTKGDANDSDDLVPIPEENIEGRYWFKVERLGKLAMYMQSPQGRLIFIGIPVAIFIIYDIIKRKDRQSKARIADKRKERQIKNLEEELKRREK